MEIPSGITPGVVVNVQDIICKTEAMGAARITALEEIEEICKAAEAAWDAEIPCDWVAVHPDNRSGAGVGGSEAQGTGWGKASPGLFSSGLWICSGVQRMR